MEGVKVLYPEEEEEEYREPDFYPIRSASLLEGIVVGMLGVWLGNYLHSPLVVMCTALYSVWRIGRLWPRSYLIGLLAGAFTQGFIIFELVADTVILRPLSVHVLAPVLAGLAVTAAYYLAGGVYYFATYYRHPGSWLGTGLLALAAGWYVRPAVSFLIAVVLLPVLLLALLPLWCAARRPLQALFFAALYLFAFYAGRFSPAQQWPVLAAVPVLALVPEMLAWLNPALRHDLDSLPVITPTLGAGEKLLALREVFFLAVEFFSMTMEKRPWFGRLAPAGRYLLWAAAGLEVLRPLAHWPVFVAWPAVPVALAGLLLELGAGGYRPAAAGLAVYALGLGLGRAFLSVRPHAGGVLPALKNHPVVLVTAAMLFVLAWNIERGRPRESRAEREKWIALNRP